ncbi:MAG: RHS repeat domain-containing protein [Actinomycetota bacterium]
MISDRTRRRSRLFVATVAALTSALLAQHVVGVPSATAATSLGSASAPQPLAAWDARDLPALASADATGPRTAPLEDVVVALDATSVSTSTEPILEVDARGGAVRFRILDVADRRILSESAVIREHGGVARWPVPRGVLVDRVTYLVSVVEAARPERVVHQPSPLTVDTQRVGTQQVHDFAGVGAALVTGEPVVNWTSAGVTTLSGTAGFSLMHRPSNPTQAGLPAGWSLNASGATSPWTSLTVSGRGRQAVLAQSDGQSVTFELSNGGVFVPLLGAHDSWPGGVETDLYVNDDGTYTAIDANQSVTTFPTAGAAPLPQTPVQLEPSRSWVDGSPSLQSSWSGHRLMSLDDPVSQRSIVFTYAGPGGCSPPAAGFVSAPIGMLCRVTDWAGHVTELAYVDGVGDSVQIGRITGRADQDQHAEVTDLAWDRAGRIAAARQPLAAAAVASGFVEGLGPQDVRALTQVTYDPRGRVRTITAPAGLVTGPTQTPAQESRSIRRFEYRPDEGRMVTRVTQDGLARGLLESTADLATMDRLAEKGPNGCRMIFDFDANDNVTETRNTCDDTRMKVEFDDQGQPIREIGPSRFPMKPGSGAPVSVTRYDTERVAGLPLATEGTPLRGMVLFGYDGSSVSGVPTERSVGPLIDGRVPPSMRLTWRSNPSGNGGRWSARMSGAYTSERGGHYRFTATAPVRLWADGRSCDGVGCELQLRRGDVVDLRVTFTSTPAGFASFDLLVSRDHRAAVPISSEDLRPELHLTTETESLDQTGSGRPRSGFRTSYDYDHQVGEKVIGQISRQGTTVAYGWAPYTGTGSGHGQRISVTNPAGQTTYDEFYGGTESAPGCSGSANQGGLLKSTTRAGAATSSLVYNDAGQTVKAGGAGTQTCITYGEAGQAEEGLVTGPGADYGRSRVEMVGGNPLITSGTVISQGVARTTTTSISITGFLFQTIDSWGTTTTVGRDPQTNNVTSLREVTSGGESRTTTYTYNSLGEQTSMAVDGRVLETNTYNNRGVLTSSEFANGTRASRRINRNNIVDELEYTGFSGGTRTREVRTLSDHGAVLGRTLFGPDGFGEFRYTYNLDHRLVRSEVTGSIPVSKRSTTLDFSGPSGANGNRQTEKVVAADGRTATWSYEYGPDDQLVASTKPGVTSTPTYDAAGRTLTFGQSAFSYDSAGNLVSAVGPNGTVAFGGDGSISLLGNGGSVVTLRRSGSLLLDADGRIEAQVFGLSGGVIVALDATGTPTRWQYPDLQGSVAWQTTGNAAPVATTVYDPWGEQISPIDDRAITNSADLALAMTSSWSGSVRLPSSDDAYQIGARLYAPVAGRFLQPDPINGGSLNTYEYAIGDPINYSDPTGEFSLGKVIGMAVGMIVAASITALTKGVGAPLAAMIIKGMFAGAVGTLAGAVVEHAIDDGFVSPFNWEAAGIKMAVGAAFGGIKGSIKSVVMQAKIAAINSKIDVVSAAAGDAWSAKDAALDKLSEAFAGGDLAEINPAKAAVAQAGNLAAEIGSQLNGLESALANVGLSLKQTLGLELGIGGTKFLVNMGIGSGGYYAPKPDPGTSGEGTPDAASAPRLLLQDAFAG